MLHSAFHSQVPIVVVVVVVVVEATDFVRVFFFHERDIEASGFQFGFIHITKDHLFILSREMS